jgi:hypothetical protein
MDEETQVETNPEGSFCPQCGSEEEGFFCRKCGALLRGEEMVLCPRCHQVVPDGEYCNQCGQGLSGLALHLKQLAMAGDTFWVTSEATIPDSAPKETILVPDPSVALAPPELPDWLQELPGDRAAREVDSHVYPALRPLQRQRESATKNTSFLVVVIVFLLVLMLGLMFVTIFVLLRGGA